MNKKMKMVSILLLSSLIIAPTTEAYTEDSVGFNSIDNISIVKEQKDIIFKILEHNVKIENGIISLENKDDIKLQIYNN